MYFLKMAGSIKGNKQHEFEQTFRLISLRMPDACHEYSLSKDLQHEDEYHFISFWKSRDFMEGFARSSVFLLLKGAFQTLGELHEDRRGVMEEMGNRIDEA